MIVAKPQGLAVLAARLQHEALVLARARQAARLLAPEAVWRRADLLWPLFTTPPTKG